MCFRSIVAQRQGWDEVWTLAIETWPLCSRHAVAALSLTDSGSTNSGGLASDRQKGFFKPFSSALMILSVTYLLSNDHTHCLFFFISKFLGGSSWKVLFKFGWGYACLSVPVLRVRHVRGDCFHRRTSAADTAARRLLVNSLSGSMCVRCYQAGDWFQCPSSLPFPLCFKAQFREAHDALTCTLRITLLKDASAQNILQKVMEVVVFWHLWWWVVAVLGTSSLWSVRVMSCKDEANVWQPIIWLQEH